MNDSNLTKAAVCCHWTAMLFMLVTFGLGLLLRMQWVLPMEGFPFAYVVHGHSHVGFLGWVFNGFFMIAYKLFILEEDELWFRRLFWVCQVGVVGMLISFPMQGYALWSIIFSTIHLLASMAFVIRLMKRNRSGKATAFVLKIACWFLLVSSIGPFAMGPIMVTSLRDTILHDLGIYYYLHFQYNAWFILFLIAAAFQTWENERGPIGLCRMRGPLSLFAVSIVLTYAQSALWLDFAWIRIVAGVGGGLQLYAVVRLLLLLRNQHSLFRNRTSSILAKWSVSLSLLKVILQLVAVVPALSRLGEQHYIVIAFLHLVFLGVVTPLLWSWAIEFRLLNDGTLLKIGIILFSGGVFISQLAIIALPVFGTLGWSPLPNVFLTIFCASVVIFIAGIAVAFSSNGKKAFEG